MPSALKVLTCEVMTSGRQLTCSQQKALQVAKDTLFTKLRGETQTAQAPKTLHELATAGPSPCFPSPTLSAFLLPTAQGSPPLNLTSSAALPFLLCNLRPRLQMTPPLGFPQFSLEVEASFLRDNLGAACFSPRA